MKKQNKVYIYGKHALTEALSHMPRAIDKVFLAPNADDEKLKEALDAAGITPGRLGSGVVSKDVADASHQGVIGRVSLERLVVPYKDFIQNLEVSPKTSLVLLGEVQDPHNVGAVIRSAAAFGVSGVLIPEHNQAPVTGAVVKVSAGMAFRVPLVHVGNVNTTARDLKEKGFWIYGLDGEADVSVSEESFERPTVFILGNEAKGLRQKTRELCDTLISIPMHNQCESLNAAASAAVAFYAWSRKHPDAL